MGVVKSNQGLDPKKAHDEFETLLNRRWRSIEDKDPANRLPTILTQQRARVLLAHIDDIILK